MIEAPKSHPAQGDPNLPLKVKLAGAHETAECQSQGMPRPGAGRPCLRNFVVLITFYFTFFFLKDGATKTVISGSYRHFGA